jgi:hypothetical protein
MQSTSLQRRRAATVLALGAALAVFVSFASADSAPVGKLPLGPVATLVVERGELVSVALPATQGGKVWRLARRVNPMVLQQVSEGELMSGPVVVFQAIGKGRATVRFALTRSDASSTALAARTLTVTVVG